MRRVAVAFCVAALALSYVPSIRAADLAKLEWGSFTVDNDSSGGFLEYKSSATDDGRTVTLSFTTLEAKADGSTTEASAKMSGHYNVFQPAVDRTVSWNVEIEGHIIKSAAAMTKLTVKVGPAEKAIEWPAGMAASEKFTRSINIVLPANERLPSPFPVSLEAYARKDGATDAAYVSVSTIRISADNPKVAAR
jgi:hypothetical protein